MTAHVSPSWRKSTYSNGTGGECVEFAPLAAQAAVRDSKSPDGPVLTFARTSWVEFVRTVQEEGFTSA
ncbi:DUF397 domain-containing protein [Streptomyces sp. CA-294286]|uniref:DUF397 domain-containing protein n=1 Tax=Streptomyces sp. CA-294286 TaxID=3240070 RepID=UPI003D93AF30